MPTLQLDINGCDPVVQKKALARQLCGNYAAMLHRKLAVYFETRLLGHGPALDF